MAPNIFVEVFKGFLSNAYKFCQKDYINKGINFQKNVHCK